MNRITKGDNAMRQAGVMLKIMGYMIEKAKKVRFAQQDFFGCWDIMAVHARYGLLWVQVSTVPPYSRGVAYKKKLVDFPVKPGVKKEYWQYLGVTKNEPRFRIWHITSEGFKEYGN